MQQRSKWSGYQKCTTSRRLKIYTTSSSGEGHYSRLDYGPSLPAGNGHAVIPGSGDGMVYGVLDGSSSRYEHEHISGVDMFFTTTHVLSELTCRKDTFLST